jgi:site-specific DNA recombinase
MEPLRTRVGVYARISEDKDGSQTATARQMEDAREMAERRGWEVIDIFEDVDISAFNIKAKRPEFERMLRAIRDKEIDGVIVWKLDRLSRQQRDLARVMEACSPHKAFVASVMEPIDTRESHGQFVAELLVAQARMESANTSLRQKRKAREQAEQGLPPSSGRRCFGYTQRYAAVVPEEAAILREARDRLFAGESLRSIALDLEERGIVGTGGHAWRAPILKRLLISPTIAGFRETEGGRHQGTWPAIISGEDSLRLRSLLQRRVNGPRQSPARKYLLTGFVRCGRCGGRMHSHMRSNASGQYICARAAGYPNCGSMSVKSEPLEVLVKEMIIDAVDGTGLARAIESRGEQDDGLTESVRQDEARLEALSRDFYVDELLSREEFFAARTPLLERLEANRVRLARRDRRGVVGEFIGESQRLREAWDQRSVEWRRSFVGALLERVSIMPAAVKGRVPFDPTRVVAVWTF